MSEDISQREALRGVFDQEAANEVGCVSTNGTRYTEVNGGNFAESVLARICLEGRRADEELIGQNSEGPHVDGVVVRLAFDHLWGEVVKGTA